MGIAVSNPALKPTRLRRAAYFRSLARSHNPFMQAAIYSSVLSIAKVQPLALGRCAGLRLQSLRSFQAFLASSSRPACASSSFFGSVLRVRGAFSNPVGSNPAVKRTRILRAAYLARYAAKTRTAVDVYWRSVAVVPIGCRQVQI